MTSFTTQWIKSTQVRKQRKYRYNAPLHTRGKFLNVNVDKKLRAQVGSRSVRVRKGDTVKVLRGSYKGKTGKVDKVSVAYSKIYVNGIDRAKADGSMTLVPLEPSNVQIITLDASDKKRFSKKTIRASKATPAKKTAVTKKEEKETTKKVE